MYDLVFILLVANALQPAITGPDTSLVGGIILVIALVLTNALVDRLDRMPRMHRLFSAAPAVIIKDGEYLPQVMRREGVTIAEAEMSMREHGVIELKEVRLGVLEPDGTISIVLTSTAMSRTRRRVRFNHRSG
ncbi:MAG: YetF domain-containing protein [Candidatus Dormiibacterota bacterium]